MKIKDIKCPVCGSFFELDISLSYYDHHDVNFKDAYRYVCNDCALTSDWGRDKEEAENELRNLIAKFPPIMRLNQGDNVLIWPSDDIYTVLGMDLEAGKIHLQDVHGNADSYYPTNIKKWPWEFKREGEIK